MKITAYGPIGALLGLANIDAEINGVRSKLVPSGRECSNVTGHGETRLLICYINGKRTTRKIAIARLKEKIDEGQKIEIEGNLQF